MTEYMSAPSRLLVTMFERTSLPSPPMLAAVTFACVAPSLVAASIVHWLEAVTTVVIWLSSDSQTAILFLSSALMSNRLRRRGRP